MKFKLGEEVTVKSLDWYNSNKTDKGDVEHGDDWLFIDEMIPFLGKKGVIVDKYPDYYELSFDGTKCTEYQFCDFMLEDKELCEFCEKIKESYKEEQLIASGDSTHLYLKDGIILAQDEYSSEYDEDYDPYAYFKLTYCPKCGEKLK